MCEHLTAGCVFLKQTWLMSYSSGLPGFLSELLGSRLVLE
ncbi:hypothetical protein Zm00014a_015909 [Zea mays]|uniref:Uncharacterized protein n=1 Tax=Zea mays TaxID=4577 RepID=A0A3L6EBL1_MAIZE|nr:hypothetical protein Zm00014a_015909 [Zea mays]